MFSECIPWLITLSFPDMELFLPLVLTTGDVFLRVVSAGDDDCRDERELLTTELLLGEEKTMLDTGEYLVR